MLYDPKWEPAEVTTESWRDLLRKAADIIEEKGWVRGSYQRGNALCAISAIAAAAEIDWLLLAESISSADQGPATEAVSRLLIHVNKPPNFFRRLCAYNTYASLQNWNDASGRTEKQVVATMRNVANAV